jgi:hypothetical protein
MKSANIDFLAWVHSLPEDLRKPLAPDRANLEETSDVYQFVIDSRLLWRIWMNDEWGRFWITVDRMGPDRKPQFHTLMIDDGTFDRIDCDPYEVEDERAQTDTESTGSS